MIHVAALRLELTKIRRSRSQVLTAVVALVVGTALAGLYAGVVDLMLDDGLSFAGGEALAFVVGKASMAPAACGVLGALLVGAEFRGRSWAVTLLRLPSRRTVLVGKLGAVCLAAFALALVALALGVLVAVAVLGGSVLTDDPAASAQLVAAHVLVCAGWGLLGASSAVLLRSSLGGLAAVLGMAFVLEPVLRVVAQSLGGTWSRIADYLPFAAASAAQVPVGSASGAALVAGIGPVTGALVFGGVVLALVGAAALVFPRQDIER